MRVPFWCVYQFVLFILQPAMTLLQNGFCLEQDLSVCRQRGIAK